METGAKELARARASTYGLMARSIVDPSKVHLPLTPRPPHVYVQLEFSMVVEYKSCPAFCGEVHFVFASMQEG